MRLAFKEKTLECFYQHWQQHQDKELYGLKLPRTCNYSMPHVCGLWSAKSTEGKKKSNEQYVLAKLPFFSFFLFFKYDKPQN